ncbi:cystatin-1-like [Macrosteles quadrilineatus]|uniref:cystatin-1-like n=1 Tax=Macrosteles quadrilineatus TaxID=74068 RepID=UPI0023E18F02|nr:cystatin-1-like [Macrosteles quadrilineatus]
MEAQLIVLFVITFGAVSKAATETGLPGGLFPVDLHDPEVIQAKEFLVKLHNTSFNHENVVEIRVNKAMRQVVAGSIVYLHYSLILNGKRIADCHADIFFNLHNKMSLVNIDEFVCQKPFY